MAVVWTSQLPLQKSSEFPSSVCVYLTMYVCYVLELAKRLITISRISYSVKKYSLEVILYDSNTHRDCVVLWSVVFLGVLEMFFQCSNYQ